MPSITYDRKYAGIYGDGAGPVVEHTDPVELPLDEYPVQSLMSTSDDGNTLEALYRKPRGQGPFPTIIRIAGGTGGTRVATIRRDLVKGPVTTPLLAEGFAIVSGTFRKYNKTMDMAPPLQDVLALYRTTETLPFVDSDNITIFGGSGGAALTLRGAQSVKPAIIFLGKPATVLNLGMLRTIEYGPRVEMMGHPQKFLTEKLKTPAIGRFKQVNCPVVIFHGDIHLLKALNPPIAMPMMEEAGLDVTLRMYRNEVHGFYFGQQAGEETVTNVVRDVTQLSDPYLSVKPAGIQ